MSETNKYLTIMNKQKNGKALHLEHAAEEICFESLTVKDQEKLQEFGINPSSIPEEVYSIDCSSLNRVWHGIGMRNVHGGVEFISLTEMKRPTTIHRKGITLQLSKKGSVASCCLFSNFMDYLAYLSLSKDGKIALPKECDCIILNHHFNLSHFLVESEEYEEVNLFLPNSSAGKVLTRTIMDRNPAAVDWSGSYIHFQSLRSYAYYKFIKNKESL
jgi:hypothetical protein